MKNFVLATIITAALIFLFSCLDHHPTEKPDGSGFGMKYKGNSGLIIPGDGELLADTIIEPENATEPLQGMEETHTETITNYDNSDKTITKGKNNMDGMLLSFWHGVVAVLIGETVALMIAVAWMKIRRKDDA